MTTDVDSNDSPSEEPAVENEAQPQANDEQANDEQAEGNDEQAQDDADVQVDEPEFQEAKDSNDGAAPSDLNRFQGIKVMVSADLGRAEVPIQTLMSLGEGSVLELNREIDSPVELVAQGVPLACGEVVVVNGCFAVRVTRVYEEK